jgi:hypothetical protein
MSRLLQQPGGSHSAASTKTSSSTAARQPMTGLLCQLHANLNVNIIQKIVLKGHLICRFSIAAAKRPVVLPKINSSWLLEPRWRSQARHNIEFEVIDMLHYAQLRLNRSSDELMRGRWHDAHAGVGPGLRLQARQSLPAPFQPCASCQHQ